MFIAAGTVFLLGVVTPISFFLTFTIAGILTLGAYFLLQQTPETEEPDLEEVEEAEGSAMKSQENVVSLLNIDPIEFEFGYALIPLVDASQGGDLLDRIVMIRRQLAIDLGIVIPVVRIRDNIQLNPSEYRLKVKGNEVAFGELLLDHYLAMSPTLEADDIEGIDTTEPAFGLPAKWISEDVKDEAEMNGYTIVDPPSVVSTHLTEAIKRHAHTLLGREETKQLVEHLKESYPILVEEVTPEPLEIGDIQKILAKLLKENISIRNLPIIFETIADFAKMTNDTALLTEYVRQSLAAQITNQYVQDNTVLKVITLSPQVEEIIADSIQQTEHGNYLSLNPEAQQTIIESVSKEVEQLTLQDEVAIVICSPAIRMHLKQLLDRYLPDVVVLSYNELESDVQVQSVGVVNAA